MVVVTSWVTAVLLLVGSIFVLLAAVGLLRMEDVFLRMQATAKASTLGMGCLLVAAAIQLTDVASIMRLAAIAAFVTITSPIAAHLVGRASLRMRAPIWKGTVVNEHPECGDAPSRRGTPATLERDLAAHDDGEAQGAETGADAPGGRG